MIKTAQPKRVTTQLIYTNGNGWFYELKLFPDRTVPSCGEQITHCSFVDLATNTIWISDEPFVLALFKASPGSSLLRDSIFYCYLNPTNRFLSSSPIPSAKCLNDYFRCPIFFTPFLKMTFKQPFNMNITLVYTEQKFLKNNICRLERNKYYADATIRGLHWRLYWPIRSFSFPSKRKSKRISSIISIICINWKA